MGTEKDIMKKNLKLAVFESFPYKRLREVCDKICELGFDCEFVDNGNVVFTDLYSPNKTENGADDHKVTGDGSLASNKEDKPITLNSQKDGEKKND